MKNQYSQPRQPQNGGGGGKRRRTKHQRRQRRRQTKHHGWLQQTGGEQLGVVDENGNTPLMNAIKTKNMLKILAVLDAHSSSPDQLMLGHVNNAGNTALILVCTLIHKSQQVEQIVRKVIQIAERMVAAASTASVGQILNTNHINPVSSSQSKEIPKFYSGTNALLIACGRNFERVVRLFLEKIPDLDCSHANEYNITALGYAISLQMSQDAVVMPLFERDPKRVENAGRISNIEWTLLSRACAAKYERIASALLDTGNAKPDYIIGVNRKTTALCEALSTLPIPNASSQVVNLSIGFLTRLIQASQTVLGHADQNGSTALLLACKFKRADVANVILSNSAFVKNANVGQIDVGGNTAFQYACQHGTSMNQVATQLFNQYASVAPNAAVPPIPANALANLSVSPPQTMVELLGYPNTFGETPLYFACYNKMDKLALSLIKSSHANPGQFDKNGITSLQRACENGMFEVIQKMLVTGEARPEHVDNNGDTALTYFTIFVNPDAAATDPAAVEKFQEETMDITKQLIARGTPPGQINYVGNTALIYAAGSQQYGSGLALMDTNESKPMQVNYYLKTALDEVGTRYHRSSASNERRRLYNRLRIHSMQWVRAQLPWVNTERDAAAAMSSSQAPVQALPETGMALFNGEEPRVMEYLFENKNSTPRMEQHICFYAHGQAYLFTVEHILRTITATAVKYICHQPTGTVNPQNLNLDFPVFSTRALGISAGLVPLQDLKTILGAASPRFCRYILVPDTQRAAASTTVSFAVLYAQTVYEHTHPVWTSSSHCQAGQGDVIYKFIGVTTNPPHQPSADKSKKAVITIDSDEWESDGNDGSLFKPEDLYPAPIAENIWMEEEGDNELDWYSDVDVDADENTNNATTTAILPQQLLPVSTLPLPPVPASASELLSNAPALESSFPQSTPQRAPQSATETPSGSLPTRQPTSPSDLSQEQTQPNTTSNAFAVAAVSNLAIPLEEETKRIKINDRGRIIELNYRSDTTLGELKREFLEQKGFDPEEYNLSFLYSGNRYSVDGLNGNRTLASLPGLQPDHVLLVTYKRLVNALRGGGDAAFPLKPLRERLRPGLDKKK